MDNCKTAYDHATDPRCGASRELTIREHLDRQIETAAAHVRALTDLRDSLPGNYLESGVSRIAPLLGLTAR